jgi:hypothetical protein
MYGDFLLHGKDLHKYLSDSFVNCCNGSGDRSSVRLLTYEKLPTPLSRWLTNDVVCSLSAKMNVPMQVTLLHSCTTASRGTDARFALS